MRPGTRSLGIGVAVVLDPLHERAGAVADSRDGDLDLAGRLGHGSLLSLAYSGVSSLRQRPVRAKRPAEPPRPGLAGLRTLRPARPRSSAACSAAMRRSIQVRSCSVDLDGVLDEGALVPVERPRRRLDRSTGAVPHRDELGTAALEEPEPSLEASGGGRTPSARRTPRPSSGLGSSVSSKRWKTSSPRAVSS